MNKHVLWVAGMLLIAAVVMRIALASQQHEYDYECTFLPMVRTDEKHLYPDIPDTGPGLAAPCLQAAEEVVPTPTITATATIEVRPTATATIEVRPTATVTVTPTPCWDDDDLLLDDCDD